MTNHIELLGAFTGRLEAIDNSRMRLYHAAQNPNMDERWIQLLKEQDDKLVAIREDIEFHMEVFASLN